MFRVALIDDEKQAIGRLEKYIGQYAQERQVEFELIAYMDTVRFVDEFISQKYDIIFLDIAMPCYNGMEIAKKIRCVDDNVAIIFITNMAQYAIEGYSVHAYSFMLKPVMYADFETLMDQILPKIKSDKISESVEVVSAGQLIRIPISDITYVEIMGHKAIYHMINKEYSSWESMKSVKSKLENHSFALCNACYLINYKYVNAIQGFSVYLTDGTELSVSQSKKKAFMQGLTAFLGRE